MRRLQPDAVTIIITGYPAFQTALDAIRSQVDDYIVKPAKTEDLVQTIRHKLLNRSRHVPMIKRTVSDIIEQNTDAIIAEYISEVRKSRYFRSADLNDDEIRNHLPTVLTEVVRDLRFRDGIPPAIVQAAEAHGQLRCRQGFGHPALVEEIRILKNLVYTTIQKNLLSCDISSLIPDILRISDNLDLRLTEAMEAHITECEGTPVRRAG
jgi:hypothetical protein